MSEDAAVVLDFSEVLSLLCGYSPVKYLLHSALNAHVELVNGKQNRAKPEVKLEVVLLFDVLKLFLKLLEFLVEIFSFVSLLKSKYVEFLPMAFVSSSQYKIFENVSLSVGRGTWYMLFLLFYIQNLPILSGNPNII